MVISHHHITNSQQHDNTINCHAYRHTELSADRKVLQAFSFYQIYFCLGANLSVAVAAQVVLVVEEWKFVVRHSLLLLFAWYQKWKSIAELEPRAPSLLYFCRAAQIASQSFECFVCIRACLVIFVVLVHGKDSCAEYFLFSKIISLRTLTSWYRVRLPIEPSLFNQSILFCYCSDSSKLQYSTNTQLKCWTRDYKVANSLIAIGGLSADT